MVKHDQLRVWVIMVVSNHVFDVEHHFFWHMDPLLSDIYSQYIIVLVIQYQILDNMTKKQVKYKKWTVQSPDSKLNQK